MLQEEAAPIPRGLVVKVLDYGSGGPGFKTTQGRNCPGPIFTQDERSQAQWEGCYHTTKCHSLTSAIWVAPRDMTLNRGGLYSVGLQVLSHGRAQVTLG